MQGIMNYIRKPSGNVPPCTLRIMSDQEVADMYAYLKSVPRPVDTTRVPRFGEWLAVLAGFRLTSAQREVATQFVDSRSVRPFCGHSGEACPPRKRGSGNPLRKFLGRPYGASCNGSPLARE